ncbi:glycosyltransferase [Agromyces aurantiacus]|uniref:Glycosyltransferase n=1 Tax=Agromyces aurantiacus TaxID=165814 RepID=A0ABV9R1I9_9MICO|nr:nucleotide disphospho-sugar-binding domain-containing protein [Agromyces aurantiacus]MBM7506010.1 MGT family glycosyltransferase [Agromyces aurantiacus]
MSTYLLCASPIQGHVAPIITIARDLVSRGHDVTVLTGSRFRDAVLATGAEHLALTGIADYDDRRMQDYLPDRDRHRGIAKLEYDVQTIFVRPVAVQFRALEAAIAELAPDAVLIEGAFAGAVPLLLDDPATRPPIIGVGVIPLMQASVDTAPAGLGLAPRPGALGRTRNRLLNAFVRKVVFRKTQALADSIVRELGRGGLDSFIFDFTRMCDRYLQLSPAEFEYPRSDLSPNLRFAGTVLPPSAIAGELPEWWDELDGERPVVHVSQGTIDNKDFGRLIRPTLEALADRDLLVVAATGGRPVSELGELPANARAAEFLPYDLLLPKTDVFVTNAGFGGTQYALSHGVPIVAAGDTEDKPEVAMRVQWSGVGLTLKTGTPTPAAVRTAVERVLADPGFRGRAQGMARRIAGYDTFGIIASELEAAASARGAAATEAASVG